MKKEDFCDVIGEIRADFVLEAREKAKVRGVRKMVEEERYCVDILVQVQAIQAALNGFNKMLLSEHIHSYVVNNIRAGNDECVDDLCETIKKLMK